MLGEYKLYSIDSKKKYRIVIFNVSKIDNGYKIKRYSGLIDGTITEQPCLEITQGKAKRTVEEQTLLQLNSLIKEKKDKGYKENLDDVSEEKTDAEGRPKPMLAKDPKGKIAKIIKNKKGYASRKLDGVRMMVGTENNKTFTCSRGGGNYDVPSKLIVLDPVVKSFLQEYPDALLDGELYCHGLPLEQISGDCRLIEWDEERHSRLQFWVFDIVIENKSFKERLEILKKLQSSSLVKIVEHVEVNSEKELMLLHDKWVEEGFEGAIWRDAEEIYKIGGRDNRMIKVKLFQDAEFKVIGITEGLRDEDMVFVCEMEDGKTFEAKPVGTIAQRLEYLKNFESKYKDKMATVKYFHLSEKGVPNLPTFKCFKID